MTRRVPGELAFLDEQAERRRREDLGVRGDAEERPGVDRRRLAQLPDAVALGQDDPAVLDDGQGEARDLEGLHDPGDRGVDPGRDAGGGPLEAAPEDGGRGCRQRIQGEEPAAVTAARERRRDGDMRDLLRIGVRTWFSAAPRSEVKAVATGGAAGSLLRELHQLDGRSAVFDHGHSDPGGRRARRADDAPAGQRRFEVVHFEGEVGHRPDELVEPAVRIRTASIRCRRGSSGGPAT